jgi:hypothetical protein
MASYTDNSPTQFDPYVSQLPIIEEMSKITMERQQRYDQGIQKIQTQIDNVAGLDVIRDVDKQYLQSRLNELGTNLKSVAAADFSNNQMVTSTAGMAARIAKDPIIQNSVISTQRVRKSMSERDVANREGKGAVENDWWLDKNINQYLNNSDAKASFTGSYLQYRDIKPKMLKVLKSLHESGKDEQVPWEANSDGTVNYGKTAAAMVEKGWKGITSGQIENAIRASFDQSDLRQMDISGQYQFRNYTPGNLAIHAQAQYNQGIATVESRIAYLQKFAESHKGPKQTSQYNEAIKTIKELQTSIGEGGEFKNQLKSQLDANLQSILTNPDGVKAEMYKNGLVKEFANAHSWEETAIKYLANPYLEAEHWEKKFGIDLALANSTIAHQRETERVARGNLTISQKEFELKEKAAIGGAGFITTGGITQEEQAPQTKLANDILSTKANADAQLVDLAERVTTSMINNGADPSTKVTVPELQVMIDKGQLGPEFQSSVDSYKQTMADAGDKDAAYKSAILATKNNTKIKANNKVIEEELSKHSPITITTSDGQQVTYTPQELVNYLAKPKAITTPSFSGYGEGGIHEDLSKLTMKEKLLYNTRHNIDLVKEYKKFFEGNSEYKKQYDTVLDEEILKRVPEYVPKEVSLGVTPEKKTEWNAKTTQILGRIIDNPGGNLGLDTKKLATWLTDDKTQGDLKYDISHTGKEKQLVIRKGNEVQRITLANDEIAQIPEASTSPSIVMQNILRQRGGTTNFMKGDPEGARYTNLPNIKKYRVGADTTSDPNNTSPVFPKIYVKTTEGWKTLLYKEPMSATDALRDFNSITDEYILEQVKKQLPDYVNKLETK